MKKPPQDLLLLPNYFHKIGIILLLFSLASLFVLESFSGMEEPGKEISKSGIFLSLLFLMFSKNKIEDELTLKLRLQSFAAAFIYGVTMVVISPYTNLLFHKEFIINQDVEALILGMIFFYFMMFYFLKRKRSEE